VVLQGTSVDATKILVERIRQSVSETVVSHGALSFNMTVSSGITGLKMTDTAEAIMARVDQALYDAKGSGRNCYRVI